MTILDCCISLKIVKRNLVVLGVVDMRQLLLTKTDSMSFNFATLDYHVLAGFWFQSLEGCINNILFSSLKSKNLTKSCGENLSRKNTHILFFVRSIIKLIHSTFYKQRMKTWTRAVLL